MDRHSGLPVPIVASYGLLEAGVRSAAENGLFFVVCILKYKPMSANQLSGPAAI